MGENHTNSESRGKKERVTTTTTTRTTQIRNRAATPGKRGNMCGEKEISIFFSFSISISLSFSPSSRRNGKAEAFFSSSRLDFSEHSSRAPLCSLMRLLLFLSLFLIVILFFILILFLSAYFLFIKVILYI